MVFLGHALWVSGEIRNNRTSFIVIMTGLIESLGLPGHYVKRGRFVIFSAKIQMIASFFVYFEFA